MLRQKDFGKSPSQRISKDNPENSANIVICFNVPKFSKENCFTQPFYSTSYKGGFEPPNSKRISEEKLRNIANIGLQYHIIKFSQKSFMISVYCTTLCTERFEPPY